MSSYPRLTDSTAMVEVATSALTGSALAYAVAVAEDQASITWCFSENGQFFNIWTEDHCCYRPDRDWEIGGPLITALMQSGKWEIVQGIRPGAILVQNYSNECVPVDGESYSDESVHFDSDSLLVAACRATVWLKLGSTVSVPAELVPAVQS